MRRQRHHFQNIPSSLRPKRESLAVNSQTQVKPTKTRKLRTPMQLEQRRFLKLQQKYQSFLLTLVASPCPAQQISYVAKIFEVFKERNSKKQLEKRWNWEDKRWELTYPTTICSDLKMLKKQLSMLIWYLKIWRKCRKGIELRETTSTILCRWTFRQEIELRLLISLRSFTQYLISSQKHSSSLFKQLIDSLEWTKTNL